MTFFKQYQPDHHVQSCPAFSLFFTTKACKTYEETMIFALAAVHDINRPNDWHIISSFSIDRAVFNLINPNKFQSGQAAYAILCDDHGNIDCKPLTHQINI